MIALRSTIGRPHTAPAGLTIGHWRLRRRHILMLALAVEVLWMGVRRAELYNPPGTAVNLPSTRGHVIT